jgi:hypothetical protein
VPALRPVLVGEYEFKGSVVPYFPDIGGAASFFACQGEFVEVLGEATGVTYGDTGAFLPGV